MSSNRRRKVRAWMQEQHDATMEAQRLATQAQSNAHYEVRRAHEECRAKIEKIIPPDSDGYYGDPVILGEKPDHIRMVVADNGRPAESFEEHYRNPYNMYGDRARTYAFEAVQQGHRLPNGLHVMWWSWVLR